MASSGTGSGTGAGGFMYRRPPSTEPPRTLFEPSAAPLAAGVRGHGGSITMERTEEEKDKFPDRINLDRKGLHGKEQSRHRGSSVATLTDLKVIAEDRKWEPAP